MSDTSVMPTRPLGDSGIDVSIIGLGCNNFGRRVDLEGTRAVIDAAIGDGITFLDTADIYGPDGLSEQLMGEALKGKRDQVVLATKFGMDMHDGAEHRGRPEYVRQAAENSLRRLQTETIDYYWMHQPDEGTPIADTLGALQEYAGARELAMTDVAIGALLAQDGVTSVIAGATRPEQVHANAAAARWSPSAADLSALNEVLAAHPL